MTVAGALGEDLRTAGEGTPLDDGNLNIAAAPDFHNVVIRGEDVDRAGAGKCGTVIVYHVEVRKSVDAEDCPNWIEGPVGCCATNAIGVTELSARSVFRTVDEVVAFLWVVGGGADEAAALTESIHGHAVFVLGMPGSCAADRGVCGGNREAFSRAGTEGPAGAIGG